MTRQRFDGDLYIRGTLEIEQGLTVRGLPVLEAALSYPGVLPDGLTLGGLALAGGLGLFGATADATHPLVVNDGSGNQVAALDTAGALVLAASLTAPAAAITGAATVMGGAVVTGPGGATPSLTAVAASGQTGYIGEFVGTDGTTVKASIAVDGEFLTADDVLAPTGQVKGQTLGFYPIAGTGHPTTGAHNAGEMVMDAAGSIFACTASGTPGTWKQVTLV